MDYNDNGQNRYYYTPDDENLRRDRGGRPKKPVTRSNERVRTRLKKKARRSKRNKVLKGIAACLFVLAMLCIIVATGVGVGMYTAVSTEINDMNLSDLALNRSSYVVYVDDEGNEIELEEIKSAVNREWVPAESISDNLKNAAVAIEDERFYSHKGIDIKRTLGATAGFVLSKMGIGDSSYGGSTITQQVIKNITNEKDKSATRKIKEMMRAIALEKQLKKDDILTMYLNVIYLANNCYGVEAASDMYFGKSAADVNIAEAATIVGITQRPSAYDPYAHPEAAKKKRNTVLDKMLEHNMISEEEHKKAVKSDIELVGKANRNKSKVNSYFVDQVVSDVKADLQSQKGYSPEFAEQQLTNGGLRIYATIDMDIQRTMEKVFEKTSNFPNSNAEAAMAVIDPYTGEIKGLVGGLGKKTDVRGFNRATQAKRQPGSAIKPLAVYAPAVDLGKITQATVIKDEKITVGSDNWEPSNAYSGFKGDMSLHEAIGRSANIPAVKVLDMVGINKSYSYMSDNFKITTMVSADKNYSSLSLGGLTKGVTVKEMAAAYGAFVNKGKYIKPYTYSKAVDATGRVVLENKPVENQAIKETTAFIMADLLKEPVNSGYGTARGAKLSRIPTYGKTGTTNDNFDKWFVGFTPYYVGAVWYGYDSPKSVGGSNPSVSVWKLVMEEIHKGLSGKEISKPDGITEAKICLYTGKLARGSCDSENAYFETGTQPKKMCSGHAVEEEPTETPEATGEAPQQTLYPEGVVPTISPKPTQEREPSAENVPIPQQIPDLPPESFVPPAAESVNNIPPEAEIPFKNDTPPAPAMPTDVPNKTVE